MVTRVASGLLCVMSLLIVTGCSSTSTADVQSVVSRFYAAYDSRNGAAACALLAPATRTEVATAAGKPCAAALLEEKLAGTGRPSEAAVYGDKAQVRMSGDTVFAARFPDGWRIVAVGCTRIPEKPYTCVVEGG
jgi:hypothetical protein